MGVLPKVSKLREIEGHAMCYLVVKRRRSNEWSWRWNRHEGGVEVGSEDLKCDANMGPTFGLQSDLTQNIWIASLICEQTIGPTWLNDFQSTYLSI